MAVGGGFVYVANYGANNVSVIGSRGGSSSIPMWVQAYGRSGPDATCEDGWDPSWNQWPNDGQGGWVCTRSVPMYG